jgi:hypothetical protein
MDSREITQAAYVNSLVVCAMITAMGMQAENMQRKHLGQSMAYQCNAFVDLIREFGIGCNDVIKLLRD